VELTSQWIRLDFDDLWAGHSTFVITCLWLGERPEARMLVRDNVGFLANKFFAAGDIVIEALATDENRRTVPRQATLIALSAHRGISVQFKNNFAKLNYKKTINF
jgi:hypothetical protein